MTREQENRAIVERFLDEYYRKGNVDIFDELLASQFFFAGVGAQVRDDLQKLKDIAASTHAMIHTAVPDFEVLIDEIIVEGDRVAARFTEQGTLTGPYVAGPTRIEPTGKSFRVTAMEFFHIADGKIKSRWAARDRLSFLQQVGAPLQVG